MAASGEADQNIVVSSYPLQQSQQPKARVSVPTKVSRESPKSEKSIKMNANNQSTATTAGTSPAPLNPTGGGGPVSTGTTTPHAQLSAPVPMSVPLTLSTDAVLLARLRAQVEFYFSPQNLSRDTYLRSLLYSYGGAAVPLSVICNFPKVRELCASSGTTTAPNVQMPADPGLLMRAVEGSSVVLVSPDAAWISPISPLPPLDPALQQRQQSMVAGAPGIGGPYGVGQAQVLARVGYVTGTTGALNSGEALTKVGVVSMQQQQQQQQRVIRTGSPLSQKSSPSTGTGGSLSESPATTAENSTAGNAKLSATASSKGAGRLTVILRDIPSDWPVEKVTDAFTIDSIRPTSARPDLGNTWYITFATEAEALDAVSATREKNIDGYPIRARIKSEAAPPATPPSSIPIAGKLSTEINSAIANGPQRSISIPGSNDSFGAMQQQNQSKPMSAQPSRPPGNASSQNVVPTHPTQPLYHPSQTVPITHTLPAGTAPTMPNPSTYSYHHTYRHPHHSHPHTAVSPVPNATAAAQGQPYSPYIYAQTHHVLPQQAAANAAATMHPHYPHAVYAPYHPYGRNAGGYYTTGPQVAYNRNGDGRSSGLQQQPQHPHAHGHVSENGNYHRAGRGGKTNFDASQKRQGKKTKSKGYVGSSTGVGGSNAISTSAGGSSLQQSDFSHDETQQHQQRRKGSRGEGGSGYIQNPNNIQYHGQNVGSHVQDGGTTFPSNAENDVAVAGNVYGRKFDGYHGGKQHHGNKGRYDGMPPLPRNKSQNEMSEGSDHYTGDGSGKGGTKGKKKKPKKVRGESSSNNDRGMERRKGRVPSTDEGKGGQESKKEIFTIDSFPALSPGKNKAAGTGPNSTNVSSLGNAGFLGYADALRQKNKPKVASTSSSVSSSPLSSSPLPEKLAGDKEEKEPQDIPSSEADKSDANKIVEVIKALNLSSANENDQLQYESTTTIAVGALTGTPSTALTTDLTSAESSKADCFSDEKRTEIADSYKVATNANADVTTIDKPKQTFSALTATASKPVVLEETKNMMNDNEPTPKEASQNQIRATASDNNSEMKEVRKENEDVLGSTSNTQMPMDTVNSTTTPAAWGNKLSFIDVVRKQT